MSYQRRKMLELADQLPAGIYFTTSPDDIDIDDWWGCKYFICYSNSMTILKGFKNIPDTIEFMENIIKNGIDLGSRRIAWEY